MNLTDGSGALQPQQDYMTRDTLIEVVREVVNEIVPGIIHNEMASMKLDIQNIRLAVNGAAKKEDTVSEKQVDTKIQESEKKIIKLVSDQVDGLIDTVRQYGERTENVQREGQEQIRQMTAQIVSNNEETNKKILKLNEQLVDVSNASHEASNATRAHTDTQVKDLRKQVQEGREDATQALAEVDDFRVRLAPLTVAIAGDKETHTPSYGERLEKIEILLTKMNTQIIAVMGTGLIFALIVIAKVVFNVELPT